MIYEILSKKELEFRVLMEHNLKLLKKIKYLSIKPHNKKYFKILKSQKLWLKI